MKKAFPELRKQNHKRLDWSYFAPVHGFDTETYKGKAILLCSDEDYIEPNCIMDIILFLFTKQNRQAYNFFFNIKFDFGAMLKWLGEEEPDLFRELIMENETEYKGYELYYIPSKLFQLRKHKNKVEFFDLTNFYYGTLKKNMEQYLDIRKFGDVNAGLLNKSYRYYMNNREKVIQYCLQDAKGAKELGVKLQESYKNSMGFYPKSYMSKAFVSANYFRQECYIPTINKLPLEMLHYWWEQYKGGRFEVYQKGYFSHVYDYDLTSAYPATIANLINIKAGKWKKVDKVHERAYYGVYQCLVNVGKCDIPPLGMKVAGKLIFPIGKHGIVYLTKDEIEKLGYLNVKVKDGWEFYPKKLIYPFKDTIDKLVKIKTDMKKYGKDSMEYMLPKITMNSFYGKFLNVNNGVAGKFWNIIYGALTTTETKIRVWELAQQAGKNLVTIETDGIFTTKKLDVRTGNKLGDWELAEQDDMVVIGNGVFKNSSKLKTRGFPKKKFDIDSIIKLHPNDTTFSIKTEKPVTMKEALIQHKYEMKDINVWNETVRTIDCNSDMKRIWERYDLTFKELSENSYRSSPLVC